MIKALLFSLIVTFSATAAEFVSTIPFEQIERKMQKEEVLSEVNPSEMELASMELWKLGEEEVTLDKLGDGGLGSIIMIIDQLIAIGSKLWKIIEAGKNVVQTEFNVVHVLPKVGDPDGAFYEMENWQKPKLVKYEIRAKNKLGNQVVTFQFAVLYQYGGSFEGNGQYLTGIKVLPIHSKLSWGWNLDASTNLAAISNMGSKQDPLAGATMVLDYRIKSFLSEIPSSVAFFVTGDGEILKL